MKKKYTATPLVDEHLKALQQMQEAETDDFFYTKLKAKMQSDKNETWNFPFKPAWVITLLAIFFCINAFVVSQQIRSNKKTDTEVSSLKNFASSYNLSVSTSF